MLAALLAVTVLGVVAPSARAAPGNPRLMVSDGADHSRNRRPLDGQALRGDVYIWINSRGARIESVGFVLDGTARQVETIKPWDFNGGLLVTNVIPDGSHLMQATVHRPNGGDTVVTASF